MAAHKRPTHEVTNPALYLQVEGVLVAQPLGKHLTLDKKTGDRLIEKGMVKAFSEVEASDLSGAEAKNAEKALADAEKLRDEATVLRKEGAELKDAAEALKIDAEKLKEAAELVKVEADKVFADAKKLRGAAK